MRCDLHAECSMACAQSSRHQTGEGIAAACATAPNVRHLQGQRASNGDEEGSFRDNNQLNSFMSQRSKRAIGRQASLVCHSALPERVLLRADC